jgi:hypothetical protein
MEFLESALTYDSRRKDNPEPYVNAYRETINDIACKIAEYSKMQSPVSGRMICTVLPILDISLVLRENVHEMSVFDLEANVNLIADVYRSLKQVVDSSREIEKRCSARGARALRVIRRKRLLMAFSAKTKKLARDICDRSIDRYSRPAFDTFNSSDADNRIYLAVDNLKNDPTKPKRSNRSDYEMSCELTELLKEKHTSFVNIGYDENGGLIREPLIGHMFVRNM